MVKYKKHVIAIAICACAYCFCACGGNIEPEATDDAIGITDELVVSSTEEQTTVDKDSELQTSTIEETTTQKVTETTKETESTTKKQETTTKKETTKTPETTKKAEKTTKETTTSKKEEPTTTKKQETTTKKQTTSQEQTTINPAMTSINRKGPIAVPADEFVPSEAAKAKAKTIVSKIITSKMSDYECVKAIHDYIVKNVNYDIESIKDNSINEGNHPSHTAEGALCGNLAVCDGYAQAFELLCAQAGIQAYMMYGEGINSSGGTESHAWNVVKINGEWYQIDCTWDDPIINGQVVSDGSNITYTYFLLTDNEMYEDHNLDSTWSKNAKKCTSTLFKGLGQRLAIEVNMTYEGVVLADINSFYAKSTDYISNNKWTFSIAIPVAEHNKLDSKSFAKAVGDGVGASGYVGGYKYGYSLMQVGDYVVYNIKIEKQ